MMTLLIRCATWALIGWLVCMNPVVAAGARRAMAGWRAAWTIDPPTCGVRTYGLLVRTSDCETETE